MAGGAAGSGATGSGTTGSGATGGAAYAAAWARHQASEPVSKAGTSCAPAPSGGAGASSGLSTWGSSPSP